MSKVTSERLGYQRQLHNLSRKVVAELIDKSVKTVADYENNKCDPPYAILVQLANLYKCTTDYLLGNDEMYPSANSIDMTELSDIQKNSVRQLVESMITTNHDLTTSTKTKL